MSLFVLHKGQLFTNGVHRVASTFKDCGEEAIAMRKKQVARFLDYSALLLAKAVNRWTREIQRWEDDDSKPNPFVDPNGGRLPFFLNWAVLT